MLRHELPVLRLGIHEDVLDEIVAILISSNCREKGQLGPLSKACVVW